MYPKVKVREEKQRDDEPPTVFDRKREYLLLLQESESLSLGNSYSPVKEPYVSPSYVARIPESYIQNVPVMPSTSEPNKAKTIDFNGTTEKEKTIHRVDEENRVNIRAGSIPRPRAVLSSPDNDLVIGKKNRNGKSSALKTNNPVRSRHKQCKVNSIRFVTENYVSAGISKKPVDTMSVDHIRPNGNSGIAVSSQRRYLGPKKPSSVQI